MRQKTFKRLLNSYKLVKSMRESKIINHSVRHREITEGDIPRILRDFSARPEEEQRAFIYVTWCDSCNFSDLGMIGPVEYGLGDKIYLEGECARCRSDIVSEIVLKEESGLGVDIICPIRDGSKPANSYLPRGFSPSPINRGYTAWNYPNRQNADKLALPLKIALWMVALTGVVFIVYNIINTMIYG